MSQYSKLQRKTVIDVREFSSNQQHCSNELINVTRKLKIGTRLQSPFFLWNKVQLHSLIVVVTEFTLSKSILLKIILSIHIYCDCTLVVPYLYRQSGWLCGRIDQFGPGSKLIISRSLTWLVTFKNIVFCFCFGFCFFFLWRHLINIEAR